MDVEAYFRALYPIGLPTQLQSLVKETPMNEESKPEPAAEPTPEPLPGLVEGRCCHYVAYNRRHLAAMVVGFCGHRADLFVLTNMQSVTGVKNFGQQFHQDVLYSEEHEPGTWHWIERA